MCGVIYTWIEDRCFSDIMSYRINHLVDHFQAISNPLHHMFFTVDNNLRLILKEGPHKKLKADIYESLIRCYRPYPCCKVSIQLQSPLFDSGDRLWCGARLAVLREVSILISSIQSRIFGVNTVKNLRSPHLSRRQLVPKQISQR